MLTPDGRVVHAEGDAQLAGAQTALSNAARAIDEARGKLRRRDPDEALGRSRTLVLARWTLLEQFENDGKRYLLARENPAEVPEVAALTPRERQVLTYAAMGHHNKLIAYELGLAPSTVRVLFMRAAQKFGTDTREATVGKFSASTRPADGEA